MTEEGRAGASRNSLKHGLAAEQIVLIFSESEDDFTRFHDEMRASFAPTDAVEEQLVEHAVMPVGCPTVNAAVLLYTDDVLPLLTTT